MPGAGQLINFFAHVRVRLHPKGKDLPFAVGRLGHVSNSRDFPEFLGAIVDGNPARFHWTTMSIFCLLYLAIIGSSLTFLLLYWLLPRMSVTNLQTISLITPPGAVMLGWALGGEKFPLWSLFGAAVVLAGVWIIFRRTKDQNLAEATAAVPDRG